MNNNTETRYTVIVHRSTVLETTNLEEAIRVWNYTTATMSDVLGGIEVQSFNDHGVMIRDGWILHVKPRGVYLSPTVVRALASA